MTGTRCDVTELLAEQCACPAHRGGALPKPTDGLLARSFLTARFPGVCCLDRSHTIEAGDAISRVVPEENISTHLGYACAQCTAGTTE